MAVYSKVERRIWRDEKVRPLSDDGKTCFLYLLTSPHGNIMGMYVLSAGYGASDLNWSVERFSKAFQEVLAQGFISYDNATDLVLVKKYLVHNPIENPNQVTAALKMLAELPTSQLFAELDTILEQLAERFAKQFMEPLRKQLAERLGERYAKPVSVTVSVTVEEKASSIVSTDLVASSDFDSEIQQPPCPGCLKHPDTRKKYLAQCQRLDLALGHLTMSNPNAVACGDAIEQFCNAVQARDVEWCKPSQGWCYPLLIEPRLQREITQAMTQQSGIGNRRKWAQTWLPATLTGMVNEDGEFYSTVGYKAKGRARP